MESKLLPTIIIATLFTLMVSATSHAQIIDVGSGVLTKCFVVNTPNGGILKAKHEAFDGDQLLYFDNENNICKYVSDFSYPESRFLVIAGYNTSGKLNSIIYRISLPEGLSCRVTTTVSYDESQNPLFDYAIYYSEDFQEWQSDIGVSSIFPSSCTELDISNYINVNNLKNTIDLKEVNIPNGCEKVTFRRPEKDDYAMLNVEDIGWIVRVVDVETDNAGNKSYIINYEGKHERIEESKIEDVEKEVYN